MHSDNSVNTVLVTNWYWYCVTTEMKLELYNVAQKKMEHMSFIIYTVFLHHPTDLLCLKSHASKAGNVPVVHNSQTLVSSSAGFHLVRVTHQNNKTTVTHSHGFCLCDWR